VAVLGTGIVLSVVGPGNAQWLFLHKASFVLWFGVMTIHVLNYAPRLPRLLSARPGDGGTSSAPGGTPSLPGGAVRWLGLAVSLAVGIGIAAVSMQLSAKWGVSL